MVKGRPDRHERRCIHAINFPVLQVADIQITCSAPRAAEANIAQAGAIRAVGQAAVCARARGAVQPINTAWAARALGQRNGRANYRSEEHTSELQSHSFISYAVF